jgi:large subunit ribosomal protein L23
MEILIKPIITEKMAEQAEKLSRYGFIVNEKANKLEIKNAIQQAYGVSVTQVNTSRYIGKIKMRNTTRGLAVGIVNRCKKATVTLKKGDVIDFYASI